MTKGDTRMLVQIMCANTFRCHYVLFHCPANRVICVIRHVQEMLTYVSMYIWMHVFACPGPCPQMSMYTVMHMVVYQSAGGIKCIVHSSLATILTRTCWSAQVITVPRKVCTELRLEEVEAISVTQTSRP